MSTHGLSRATLVACVLVPTAAVVAARAILPNAGPRGAAASAPLVTSGSKAADRDALAPRTRGDHSKVLSSIDDLRDGPIGPSPFVSQVPRALTKIVMTTPEVVHKRLPEFTLTSIAGGTRQTIAMIDSKVRRVGDDLGEGWVVSGIEHASGEVIVKGPDGMTITLTLRK